MWFRYWCRRLWLIAELNRHPQWATVVSRLGMVHVGRPVRLVGACAVSLGALGLRDDLECHRMGSS